MVVTHIRDSLARFEQKLIVLRVQDDPPLTIALYLPERSVQDSAVSPESSYTSLKCRLQRAEHTMMCKMRISVRCESFPQPIQLEGFSEKYRNRSLIGDRRPHP